MRQELLTLLGLACVSLVGLGVCSLQMLRLHRRSVQAAQRIEHIVSPHRRGAAEAPSSLMRLASVVPSRSLGRRALLVLGYDPALRERYGLRPALVIAVAFAPAVASPLLLSGLLGPLCWPVGLAGWVMLSRAYFRSRDRKLTQMLFRQFPDALAMIVRAVRVGVPVAEGIRLVGKEAPAPTGAEFSRVADQMAIGVPLDEALRDMAQRVGMAEYRFFATALGLQSQTGGGLSETLDGLADTIRKRVAARARGHALSAEARMSMYFLGGLPIVVGGLLTLVNPSYIGVLFNDPTGQKLLLGACTLLGLGLFSMRTIIRRSLS